MYRAMQSKEPREVWGQRGKNVVESDLNKRSRGLRPWEKVYWAGSAGGMVLSECQVSSCGEPNALRFAHSWTADYPPELVLWLLYDPEMSFTSHSDWISSPQLFSLRGRLTVHPVSIISWDWLKAYTARIIQHHRGGILTAANAELANSDAIKHHTAMRYKTRK